MIKERINVPSRDPEIRAKDFLEVSTGFTTEQARAEAPQSRPYQAQPCVDTATHCHLLPQYEKS